MEPTFNPGGMVVTRPVKPEDIKVGDTILFQEPVSSGFICHRVIDIKGTGRELFFQTKGDANEYPDPDPVSLQNFIGKTIFYIPQVGKIAYLSRLHETPIIFMGNKISVAMLIILALGLTVIGMEFKNIWELTSGTELKEYQEVVKRRKAEVLKRRRRFA
jgi:signal peptidase I